MKKLWTKIINYKPKLVLSCLSTLIFGGLAIYFVITGFGFDGMLPSIILYASFVTSAISFCFAVWAIMICM